MRNTLYYVPVVILILFFGRADTFAQELYFSQLQLNRDLHQVATSGLFDMDTRLVLAYRSYLTKKAPYRALMLSYDQKMNSFNFGIKVVQNDAGAASLKSTQVLLNFAYQKHLNESGDLIAFGLRPGVIQQRFKSQDFKFDNQYVEGDGFDSERSDGESFSNTNQILPVISVGILGKKYFETFTATLGFSMNNINEPASGFYQNYREIYPTGIAVYTSVEIPFNDRIELATHFAFNSFYSINERNAGANLKYKLSDSNAINFGLSTRIKEAIIIESGFLLKQTAFVISWDINYSAISEIDGYKNLLELSVTHNLKK